jgi:septum formation protein
MLALLKGLESSGGVVEIILASTSPYRRALLERLGLPFRVLAPTYPEIGPADCDDPRRLATQNALGKALSLLEGRRDCLVIGSDQVVTCEGVVFTKPGTEERAVEQLLRLAGREHELLTAVAVVRAPAGDPGPAGDMPGETALAVNQVRLRPLTRAEAEAYVRIERPLDCAGAYKSEGLGIALLEYLRGDDPTGVVGLPLITVARLLRRLGLDPLLRGEQDRR